MRCLLFDVRPDGLWKTGIAGVRGQALSPKIVRAVMLRDGHCRWPGCNRRNGLQIHHLLPRSRGGTDDIANLAAVCACGITDHHHKLIPTGPWHLTGNPNLPDGLRLVYQREHDGHSRDHDARAGPDAA